MRKLKAPSESLKRVSPVVANTSLIELQLGFDGVNNTLVVLAETCNDYVKHDSLQKSVDQPFPWLQPRPDM